MTYICERDRENKSATSFSAKRFLHRTANVTNTNSMLHHILISLWLNQSAVNMMSIIKMVYN